MAHQKSHTKERLFRTVSVISDAVDAVDFSQCHSKEVKKYIILMLGVYHFW